MKIFIHSNFCFTLSISRGNSLIILFIFSCFPIVFLSLTGFCSSNSIVFVKDFLFVEILLMNSFFSIVISPLLFLFGTNSLFVNVFCFFIIFVFISGFVLFSNCFLIPFWIFTLSLWSFCYRFFYC